MSALLGSALVGAGVRRSAWAKALLSLAGGALLARGLSGHCPVYASLGMTSSAAGERGVTLSRSITVLRPRDEVYRAWRDLERLPRFAWHVRQVKELGGGRSHWVAQGPFGTFFEWTAELTEDVPAERIGWRTLPGAGLRHEGTLTFLDSQGGHGTQVQVRLHYVAPGGRLGVLLARLLGEEPRVQVADDLRRFKQLLETGEVPAVEPKPGDGSTGARAPGPPVQSWT